MKKKEKKEEVNPLEYFLTPKMKVLNKKEKEAVKKQYGIEDYQFPKIKASDPAVKALDAKVGDLIKIDREDETGKYTYYRIVIE